MRESNASDLLTDRYNLLEGTIYLSGIHALARLPLDVRRADFRAGLKSAGYISGYEGSPLGGYDLELLRNKSLLDQYQIVFQPAVNEELAATAIQGTQLVSQYEDRKFEGITGYWYGKAPGLDRSADALRHANMAGTQRNGGVVALVGDDPSAKSSSVPSASEHLMADLGMPILYPADSQEILDLGLHAVYLSRVSGLWVGMKIVTNVADGSSTAEVKPGRILPVYPEVLVDGKPYVHHVTAQLLQPNLTGLEKSRDGVRLEIARQYARLNNLNEITASHPGDRIGIVAPGRTYLDLLQALSKIGIAESDFSTFGIRLLHLRMIHPLDTDLLRSFADGLKEIIVVEEKRAFIESAMRNQLYGIANPPLITGKQDNLGATLFPAEGEFDADIIVEKLIQRFSLYPGFDSVINSRVQSSPIRHQIALPLVRRTPYYCSGCPHNTSRQTPDGSLVGGGIGCHSISLFMEAAQVGEMTGITQMGGEGAQWLGMAPFMERKHLLQNLGDGTFHHSGSLAVRAAIAAKVNITYKLLHNSAVALTGGQAPAGEMSLPNLVRELLAEGVNGIIITSPTPRAYKRDAFPPEVQVWHRDRIVEAQERLAKIPGVTVLIHDQECAAGLRRKRKRGLAPKIEQRIMINERVCEGCGDCGLKSNCLSVQPVETEFGMKTRIDQSSCNQDFTCLKGDCPAFITVIPNRSKKSASTRTVKDVKLPDPVATIPSDHFVMRILGIGGTGVVTLAQTLGVAASFAGKEVRSLDQTGLSQKGGSVVSDLKIGTALVEESNKAASEECDLYLGADILVANDPRNLTVASTSRTVPILSNSVVATGHMVTNRDIHFPAVDELLAPIEQACRPGSAVIVDSREISRSIFGDDQYANVVLAGTAFQAGALPLPLDAIERAIALNGVAVEANLAAFHAGRVAAVDMALLEEFQVHRAPVQVSTANLMLSELVERRALELVKYQNEKYASEYRAFVAKVSDVERERFQSQSDLSRAVAESLFKLMAYKDEYEVARLSLAPEFQSAIDHEFGQGAQVSFLLHPPILRAMGVKGKLKFGSWFKPGFRTLQALKGLRGTAFDPFGFAEVRKVERALIGEYRALIEKVIANLSAENYQLAVRIARLPEMVRGYEEIKLANVDAYRSTVDELLKEFTSLSTVAR